MSSKSEAQKDGFSKVDTYKVRRIAILGARAVGKSSLTIQFVENNFLDSYYPTIESTYTKTLSYKGQPFVVEIIDTAGQDEYSILASQHAIGIHGYVLVYSVTSLASFELIKVIREKILNFTGTKWVPIIIVGNKIDLGSQRQVSPQDAEALAQEWNCQCIESSAKENENTGKTFEMMIQEIEKSLNPNDAEAGTQCSIL